MRLDVSNKHRNDIRLYYLRHKRKNKHILNSVLYLTIVTNLQKQVLSLIFLDKPPGPPSSRSNFFANQFSACLLFKKIFIEGVKTLTQINCFRANNSPRLFKLYYQSSLETRTIRKLTRKAQPIMSRSTHTSKHWTWFKYLITSIHLHRQKIWRFSGKPLWDN